MGAEAGGEEEWAEEHGDESREGVGDEEEAVVDELAGVSVGVSDDGVFGEDEDGDGGEADGDPEGGFGDALAASGWGAMRRGGHGGGRHRVIRSVGAVVRQVVVAGMIQGNLVLGIRVGIFLDSGGEGGSRVARMPTSQNRDTGHPVIVGHIRVPHSLCVRSGRPPRPGAEWSDC